MDNVNQPAAGGSKTGMWVALIIAVIVLGVGAYFIFTRDNGTNTNNANAAVNSAVNANANSAVNATINQVTNTNENAGANTNEVANTDSEVDTSDWQTYTNSEYGYTISYPKDWTHSYVNEDADPNATYVGPLHYSSVTSADNHVRLLLGIERTGDIGTTYYRTGIGAGDIVAGDQINVAGDSVDTWQRVFEDRVVEVFLFPALNGVSSVAVDGHDLTASFSIVDSDTYSVDITETSDYKIILEILSSIGFSE